MTELEAAEKLGALLNEIEEAGHMVYLHPDLVGPGHHIAIGEGGVYIAEPPCEGEPWEVVES